MDPRCTLAPLVLLLMACAGAPAGRWQGEITCGDEDGDGVITAALDLGKEDETTFSGPGEVDFTGIFEFEGVPRDYAEEVDYDEVVLMLEEPSGAQEVTLSGAATSCQTTVDGQVTSTDCTAGNDLDWTLQWDGKSSLTMDMGDCAGELTRD